MTNNNTANETPLETYELPHHGWKWEILEKDVHRDGVHRARVYSPMLHDKDSTVGTVTIDQIKDAFDEAGVPFPN